jgi:hypothetical protein
MSDIANNSFYFSFSRNYFGYGWFAYVKLNNRHGK